MSLRSIILNGAVVEEEAYTEDVRAFYEVIRVKDRALMFLEDHVQRLNNSLERANIQQCIATHTVQSDLARLFQVDGIKNQNVKIAVSVENEALICALYYIESTYLPEDTYKKGVPVKMKSFERENPEIKQLTNAMQALRKQLQIDNVYEYLLVDQEGLILEGTKSNVFFVQGRQIITADTQRVLGGITRHHVAQLARANYSLEESSFAKAHLNQLDALFLTGTSIGVLPVCAVDDISFDSANNPVVVSLMQAYATCEEEYIASHQLPDDEHSD
jgi:branched-chain amino acid aminotransferase